MSMPGIGEPSAQVLVYGPDGTMYPNPAAARAAGVTNYTMQPPAPGGGMPVQPMQPPAQQMPMPMQALQMPSSMQMPSMNLQAPEFGIVDPTYMAQLEILNQGGMNQPMGMPMGQPMGLLGSGLGPQERGPVAPFLTIPNYRPMAQSFRREAAAAGGGMSGGGGGGGDGFGGGNMGGGGGGFSGRGIGADNLAFGILGATSGPLGKFSPIGALANYGAGQYLDARTDYIGGQDFGLLNNVPGGMGTFADEYGNVGTYSSPATIAAQDEAIFGFSPGMGYMSDNSIEMGPAPTPGMGYVSDNSYEMNPSTPSTQFEDSVYDYGGGGGSDSGGSTKIVCTAMNEAYGFGSFRNRIWLAYAAKNLTKAHEAGYHALFLPLVNAGYKQDKWFSKPLRSVLENIARHRSADLRAEMRGGKRDRVGQAYRFILEPLCYAVGKLKGN